MRRDKIRQLIIELIKKTKNDELIWNSYSPKDTELLSGEFILDKVYESEISDRAFKLFRYKYKSWRDEYDFEWQSSIRLELTDKGGDTDYEFEYDNSFNDLYSIVREQTSNVTDVIDNLLGLTLEILEATYSTPRVSLDVTQELKDSIQRNKINILASNEIKGDPEPGIVKKLKVKYNYGDEPFEKEVGVGQRLILP